MRITALALVALLTGCAAKEPEPVHNLNLPWPEPVDPVNIKLQVNEDAQVLLSWEDYLDLSIFQLDTLRYIKNVTSMVCQYQPEDERCETRTNRPSR